MDSPLAISCLNSDKIHFNGGVAVPLQDFSGPIAFYA